MKPYESRTRNLEPESRTLSIREILRHLRPKALFPDLVSDYEEYHTHVDTGHPLRAKLISPWIEPHSRVLDVGCGDGVMAQFLKEKLEVEVEGIDISETAAAKTRARGIPARTQDLDASPDLAPGFDYVLFIEVLEHLRSPHLILREAVRQARRGVIVTIPNSGWIGYRLNLLAGHVPVQSFTHLHLWTHADFLAFCQRLGFQTPQVRFLMSKHWLRRAIVSRFPNLLAHQLAYMIPSETMGKSSA